MIGIRGFSQPHPRTIMFWLASLLALAIFSGCSSEDGGTQQSQQAPLTSVDLSPIVEEDLAANVPSSTASTATETAVGQQPARKLNTGLAAVVTTQASAAASPNTEGAFDPPHNWPTIPLAVMVMPDGKVFAYGSGSNGAQGSTQYVVWDPTKTPDWNDLDPNSSLAFKLYNNDTQTDTFCAAHTLLFNGDALMLGGDFFAGTGIRNNGNNAVTTFTPGTETLTQETSPLRLMSYPRWYPTSVTLPNQETLIMGGRSAKAIGSIPAIYPDAPEVRQTDGTWRTLWNASISHVNTTIKTNALAAYGNSGWYYPRAWVHPNGGVFIFGFNGRSYNLNPDNTGTLSRYAIAAGTTPVPGISTLASVMYATGKILSIRKNPDTTPLTGPFKGNRTIVVDITGAIPAITPTSSLMNYTRHYGSLTVLADGTVWANGGGALPQATGVTQKMVDDYAVYSSELWNGNNWTLAANATLSRLYHSTALLLPDGRVFTGGGGAPGYKTQRNGEIYNPPYLYDADNILVTDRPIIESAPSQTTSIPWGSPIEITANGPITRITLVRSGSATHNFNNEARFFDYPGLTPQEAQTIISITAPANANIAPPGYYMIFAWNSAGVPSVAKIIKIG